MELRAIINGNTNRGRGEGGSGRKKDSGELKESVPRGGQAGP